MAALLLELEDPEEGAARIHQGMLTNCKVKVGRHRQQSCLAQYIGT